LQLDFRFFFFYILVQLSRKRRRLAVQWRSDSRGFARRTGRKVAIAFSLQRYPKPHPPRNRGEGTGVDGLMPVGQEDTPKR
jgi:hypothetical protein